MQFLWAKIKYSSIQNLFWIFARKLPKPTPSSATPISRIRFKSPGLFFYFILTSERQSLAISRPAGRRGAGWRPMNNTTRRQRRQRLIPTELFNIYTQNVSVFQKPDTINITLESSGVGHGISKREIFTETLIKPLSLEIHLDIISTQLRPRRVKFYIFEK